MSNFIPRNSVVKEMRKHALRKAKAAAAAVKLKTGDSGLLQAPLPPAHIALELPDGGSDE